MEVDPHNHPRPLDRILEENADLAGCTGKQDAVDPLRRILHGAPSQRLGQLGAAASGHLPALSGPLLRRNRWPSLSEAGGKVARQRVGEGVNVGR